MTTRRTFLVVLTASACIAPNLAPAQKPGARTFRIGWLSPNSPDADSRRLKNFREALVTHGYIEGKNLLLEVRWADGRYERLDALARELVQMPVDLLVTSNTASTQAAKRATTEVPIIMAGVSGDPVSSGLIASLARPGANVTGVTGEGGSLSVKLLELTRETVSGARRVAFVHNPDSRTATAATVAAAAKTAKLELAEFPVKTAGELQEVFRAIAARRVDAVVVQADAMLMAKAAVIADLALKYRLPSFGNPQLAQAGGVIGYGSHQAEIYRGVAAVVDKILKGAKPAELPVQQVSRFTLVVNARTAKALGLALPGALMLRADQVIE